jgi:hypothetical protein
MQTIQPVKRGGRRRGAGRPRKPDAGIPMRVPVSLMPEVREMLEPHKAGKKPMRPLIVMKACMSGNA